MKDEILKLKKEGKTYIEIKDILGCSISTISYHCNKNGVGTDIKISDELISKIQAYYLTHTVNETAEHFEVSSSSVKKYCENKRVFLTNEERRKNKVNAVIKRRRKIKRMAVEYKGGKCSRCGYNKYIGALEFHHLDPSKKDFSLGSKGHCVAWEKVKLELDKCILVCSNCHKEIHGEIE